MVESHQQLGQSQSLLSLEALQSLGKSVVDLSDALERHGLVDYEMGFWEERIIDSKSAHTPFSPNALSHAAVPSSYRVLGSLRTARGHCLGLHVTATALGASASRTWSAEQTLPRNGAHSSFNNSVLFPQPLYYRRYNRIISLPCGVFCWIPFFWPAWPLTVLRTWSFAIVEDTCLGTVLSKGYHGTAAFLLLSLSCAETRGITRRAVEGDSRSGSLCLDYEAAGGWETGCPMLGNGLFLDFATTEGAMRPIRRHRAKDGT